MVGCTISIFLTLSVLPSMVSDVFLMYIATLINSSLFLGGMEMVVGDDQWHLYLIEAH